MTDRVTAAARALCTLASRECGINEADNWNAYKAMFMKDAKAALDAADAVQPIVVDQKVKRLEAIVRNYRDKERTGR